MSAPRESAALDVLPQTADYPAREGAKAVHTIEEVKAFWDGTPLWTGDAQARGEPGSRAFFESHYEACRSELGHADRHYCPAMDGEILDLGCGIGFWLQHFANRGFRHLTGADLSTVSLELARRRCEVFGITATLEPQNAQAMTFADERFDHVNCCGVIHHSPDPRAALSEIRRVLKPGGQAVVSVYYKNAVLRRWRTLRAGAAAASRLGFRMGGRGRDDMLEKARSAEDLVRLYDGADNPIGMAFSRGEFVALIRSSGTWEVRRIFTHMFPSRVLPASVRCAHRVLELACPMMIGAILVKPP